MTDNFKWKINTIYMYTYSIITYKECDSYCDEEKGITGSLKSKKFKFM